MTDERTDGWAAGRTDGRTDGPSGGSTEGRAWAAPVAEIPVRGRVRLPGSAGATVTALAAAAAGARPVLLTDPAHTPATAAACAAARAAGAGVLATADGDWLVVPPGTLSSTAPGTVPGTVLGAASSTAQDSASGADPSAARGTVSGAVPDTASNTVSAAVAVAVAVPGTASSAVLDSASGDVLVRAVPPDLAVAAGFLAAAAVTTGTVVVRNWPPDDPAGDRVRSVLADFGTYVVRSADGLTCTSRSTSGELTGVRADLRGLPQQVPVTAVLAALAEGVTELRVDDAPEVAATAAALLAVGGQVSRVADRLIVQPVLLRGGRWPSAGIPALALAGAVLGLRTPGLVVDDISPLTAAVPGFADLWLRLMWADEHLLPGSGGGGEEPRH